MDATLHQDDPFATLGLPVTMDLDASRIESAYLARARLAHPDHARGAAGAQTTDDGPIAALNQARRTLRDPALRAEALVRALGGPGAQGDRSVPPGFLQELMAAREGIEADRISGGGALPAAALDRWHAWGERRRQELLDELGRVLRAVAPGDAAALGRARRLLNALRSIERASEQLDADPA